MLSDFFLFPRSEVVEENGQAGGKRPAEGPCHPDAGCAEAKPFCEQERQRHTQEEVGKGGCHEIEHGTAAAQHAIAHDLHGYHEIEGGNDVHEIHACLDGCGTAFIHEKPHSGAPEEEIEQEERHADQNPEKCSCLEAFGNTFLFICAEVLRGKGGNTIGQGCHAGDGEGIQFIAGGKPCDNGRAIAIDGRLHEEIPDRNKALLQNAWNGNDGNLCKHFRGKFCIRLGAS